MAVNLKKGQKINLKKENGSSLRSVTVGLGWDVIAPPKKGGFFGFLSSLSTPNCDCDASVFACKGGKLIHNGDVVYFGNLTHSSGAIRHMGDNLTGEGEGDDEQIQVELSKLPSDYDKLVFVVNIYSAKSRNQHFGMIQNAFIRIVDNDTNSELCRFNLSDNYDNMTAMIFGEIYKLDGEWKFNAIGQGTTDNNISELSQRYSK
ncbi:MAG: TerD family protein [Proteobacteria bacterium]|nr:TerD family protein [Pseudomonadota bacterium]